MKWFFALGLLSLSSFAQTRSVTTTFSFDASQGSFKEILAHGQTLNITYAVTALPVPVVTDADVKIEKEMTCITWTYRGTGPEDSGICGQYVWTGKYRLSTSFKEVPLFAVKETVTDVKTGKKRVRKLRDITLLFDVVNEESLTDRPEVPKNLRFETIVRGEFIWNCSNETVKTGPVIEDVPVNVSVCTEASGEVKLEKINGEYRLTVLPEISFRSTVSAFWLLRDFPRRDLVRKRLWFRDPSLNYVLK